MTTREGGAVNPQSFDGVGGEQSRYDSGDVLLTQKTVTVTFELL